MFKAANERLMSDVDSIIKNIKSMEPITAMKEANSVIGRKGKYKNLTPEQSKKYYKTQKIISLKEIYQKKILHQVDVQD